MKSGRRAEVSRRGPEAFNRYFGEVFGSRWPALRTSLEAPVSRERLVNPFGLDDYELDAASARVARALEVSAGDRVADICSSPGGKALVSIFAVQGQAQWHCNDLSVARVARLRAVLHDCLPPAVLANIRVSSGDGARFGLMHAGQFDRVLADVPCSGERHLLKSARELSRWSEMGSKRLAVRQHAILCAALDSVREGGRVVYSTCSLSPHENDGVIAKLSRSRSGRFVIVSGPDEGEPTAFGRLLLPDRTGGAGPMFYAILTKVRGPS